MKKSLFAFKSVRTRTLFTILPLVILILISVVIFTFIYSNQIIGRQVNENMNQLLQTMSYKIQDRITASSKVPEVFAKSVEKLYQSHSLQDFHTIASNNLLANKDTFGVGIFFEPYSYNAQTKYYSTYAYWNNGEVTTSEEYNDPGFDYPNQDFYASTANKKTTVFSAPYFDEVRKVDMVTATVPMYNAKNQFIGVTTGDIVLTTITQIVNETKVGESGWAILLDKDGTYLAGPHSDKIMKKKLQDDEDLNLANLGKRMLEEKNGNMNLEQEEGSVQVYYQELPETHWKLAIVLPDKELVAPVISLVVKMMILALIGIILIIIIVFLYSRSITSQIQQVNQISDYLSQGDFTQIIPITSRDEFGQMFTNFNHTSRLLQQMITKLSVHANHVATTSQQLTASAGQSSLAAQVVATTIQEVASGAEYQMRGTEESAQSMEELATGIQIVAESCAIVSDVSLVASQKAFQGNEIIQNAIMDMNNASQTVSETSDVITSLSERTNKIDHIIEIISDLSNQTNLLSLNASIEAARAGEYGRGFSVVAAKIRELAEESRHSADQVKMLIDEIKRDTKEAVQSMHMGTKTVKQGTYLVQQAGEVFTYILQDLDSMVGRIQEISASAEEMSAGSEQVTSTVEELSRIAARASDNSQSVAASTQEQLASMEEVAASSKSLIIMVEELQELISAFKI